MQGETERKSVVQEIVGESRALRSALRQAISAAKSDSVVLIIGEPGTGKELMARAIHRMGNRRTQSFAKLDCANVAPAELEAALFGHDWGRIQAANHGTLLLNHIDKVSRELQPRLLRALKLSGSESQRSTPNASIDVRLIATMSAIGKSIEDLWLRKSLPPEFDLTTINVPALRERRSDIPLLARHFVSKWARLMNKSVDVISPGTVKALMNYSWPGNVRELEIVIERAVRSSEKADLQLDLPSSAA